MSELEVPARIPLAELKSRTLSELDKRLEEQALAPVEYDLRVEQVERAESYHDLQAILDLSVPVGQPAQGTLLPAEGGGGEDQWVVAVMAGSTRKGPWAPAATVHAIAVMGGIQLDFREAEMRDGVTEVEAYACMGGIQITVPADLAVTTSGLGLLGGFSHTAREQPEADTGPGAARLHVSGVACMGGVEVKVAKEPLFDRLRRRSRRR